MENKYYKIGQISKIIGLPASTLRYWETEFRQLKPIKSAGGQRFYTQKHIDLLKKLKEMLYNDKYTINGAKKCLQTNTDEQQNKETINIKPSPTPITPLIISQTDLKQELLDILSILK